MTRPFAQTPMIEAHMLGTMLSNRHLPRGLSQRQAWFIAILRVRPSLTRADYQSITGVSAHTAQSDLAELLKARLIVRTAAGPATRYCLHPNADPAGDYLLSESALQSAGQSSQNRPATAAGTHQDQCEIPSPLAQDHTSIAPISDLVADILRRTFSRGE